MSATVSCSRCAARNRVPDTANGTPRCAKCKTPLPWIIDAGPDAFDSLLSASVPVLVDFWAPWCGPCRTMGPAVAAVADSLAGRLKVVKVNVDDRPELAERYEVQGIPTLLVFREGKPVARHVGALGGTQLRSWLDQDRAGRPG